MSYLEIAKSQLKKRSNFSWFDDLQIEPCKDCNLIVPIHDIHFAVEKAVYDNTITDSDLALLFNLAKLNYATSEMLVKYIEFEKKMDTNQERLYPPTSSELIKDRLRLLCKNGLAWAKKYKGASGAVIRYYTVSELGFYTVKQRYRNQLNVVLETSHIAIPAAELFRRLASNFVALELLSNIDCSHMELYRPCRRIKLPSLDSGIQYGKIVFDTQLGIRNVVDIEPMYLLESEKLKTKEEMFAELQERMEYIKAFQRKCEAADHFYLIVVVESMQQIPQILKLLNKSIPNILSDTLFTTEFLHIGNGRKLSVENRFFQATVLDGENPKMTLCNKLPFLP